MPAAPPDVDDDVRMVRTRVRGKRISRSWAKRKHLGWITVGSALLVLVLGLVFVVATWNHGRQPLSQQVSAIGTGSVHATPTDASSAPGTGATASASSSTTPSATSSAPTKTAVRGTIKEIGDSRYTMLSTTGITYTVVVTAETKFSRNRNFGTFSAGDSIAVRGTLDAGIITASTINPANAR